MGSQTNSCNFAVFKGYLRVHLTFGSYSAGERCLANPVQAGNPLLVLRGYMDYMDLVPVSSAHYLSSV